jgi:hypothetical protein
MRNLNFAMGGVALMDSMVVNSSSTLTPLMITEVVLAVAISLLLAFFSDFLEQPRSMVQK